MLATIFCNFYSIILPPRQVIQLGSICQCSAIFVVIVFISIDFNWPTVVNSPIPVIYFVTSEQMIPVATDTRGAMAVLSPTKFKRVLSSRIRWEIGCSFWIVFLQQSMHPDILGIIVYCRAHCASKPAQNKGIFSFTIASFTHLASLILGLSATSIKQSNPRNDSTTSSDELIFFSSTVNFIWGLNS